MPGVKKLIRGCLATLVFLSAASGVYAAPLLPNGAIVAPAEPDPTGGTVQAGTGVAVPFASAPGPGQYSGTLTTTVIANDPSNTLGGLTFAYRLTNDASSLASLDRMTNLDFAGFQTDVSYQTPASGVKPSSVDRDAGGSTVGWNFSALSGGVIPAGQASALLVIQTDAHAFAPVNANILDGSPAVVASFGPVPEPGTLGLVCLSIVALRQRRARTMYQ
jgi:hypothetical protein